MAEDRKSEPETLETEAAATDIEAPEPWEPWETWLCVGSVLLGIAGLAVLGIIINLYIL